MCYHIYNWNIIDVRLSNLSHALYYDETLGSSHSGIQTYDQRKAASYTFVLECKQHYITKAVIHE